MSTVISPIVKDAEGVPAGYSFLCPACDYAHQVWLRRVPGTWGGDTWEWNGSQDRPTFRASVLVRSVRFPENVTPEDRAEYDRLQHGPVDAFLASRFGTRCHSYVTDGNIEFLSDCTHGLKGQTVPLPPHPRMAQPDEN